MGEQVLGWRLLHTMLRKQLYRFCLFRTFLFSRWTQVYWT